MKKQLFIPILIVAFSLFFAFPAFAQESDGGRGGTADAHDPRTPDRPMEIEAETVEKELAEARAHGGHGHGEVEKLVESFDQAHTIRGLNHLAGMALAMLHHEGHNPDGPVMQKLYRGYNNASINVTPSFTSGYNGAGACDLDFDTPAVLGTFFDDAQSTFSSSPHWVENCGDGELRVEPTVQNHYHLAYEDSSIDCIDFNTGKFGRTNGAACDPLADATQEPRYLGAHNGAEVITIRRTSGGGNAPFTVHSFVNVGNAAVKFRYRQAGGQWFQWNSMAGNTVWDVSAYVIDVVEVQITNAGTSLACGLDWKAGESGGWPVDYEPFFLELTIAILH